ncbi:MAG: hypothetical protein IIY72_02840 [Solobacterium sp.]|nr:hypothetical protein [Solobacterium sp.]
MLSFAVITATGLLFLLVLISLGFQPKLTVKFNGMMIFLTALAGACIYGYGYSVIFSSFPQAIMRSLFSVFCMFLGRNEISAVSAAPALQAPGIQVVIYFVHMMALYCTASAVLASIGTRLLRVMNLALIRRNELHLIYGASEESIRLAEELQQEHTVIFVDRGPGSMFDDRILRMGSILFTDDSACRPRPSFLKKAGITNSRKGIVVYCLDNSAAANIRFAADLAKAMQEAGISPDKTRITVIADGEDEGHVRQAGGEQYGYGSVFSFNRAELVSRLMIRQYPPCDTMTFDEKGRALENFEAVVIGFGNLGQAALRALIMNGQFCGSRFHAVVTADSFSRQSGSFMYRYPAIRKNCNVEFREDNARSIEFYEYLFSIRETLNYVAICTGNEKENAEIAAELTGFLRNAGSKAVIIQCTNEGISRLSGSTGLTETVKLYSEDLLNSSRIDRMAMIVNQQYHTANGKTAAENWKDCDYFSRMSCRAAADYMPAVLKACGVSAEDVLAGNWQPDTEVMENLGIMEHLRWCAFHYCMGYSPMSREVFAERVRQYSQEVREQGSSRIRVTKDAENRLHACLVGWDELEALADLEEELSGVRKDYKEMDKDNIRMIPAMLKEGYDNSTGIRQ